MPPFSINNIITYLADHSRESLYISSTQLVTSLKPVKLETLSRCNHAVMGSNHVVNQSHYGLRVIKNLRLLMNLSCR